jgi:UDP-N-acetylmuramate dehydrogenase
LKIVELDFAKFSSIKVGGVKTLHLIESRDELLQFTDPFTVGGGNNLLVSDSEDRQLIKLSKDFSFCRVENGELTVGGATKSSKLFSFSRANNLHGFEFLQALPGSLGGILKMNAGLKSYEIFENLTAIRFVDGWVGRDELQFGYRFTSIEKTVLEAKFKLIEGFDSSLLEKFRLMRSNQPKGASAGSTFKNPDGYSAGYLLEKVGLRGYKIGSMGFSDMHSNFLINYGGGTFSEAIELIRLAEKLVYDKFGVELQREIVVV